MKSKPILKCFAEIFFKLQTWSMTMSSFCPPFHWLRGDKMKKPNCACQKWVFSSICSFHFSASIFILNIASKDLGRFSVSVSVQFQVFFSQRIKLNLIFDFYSKMKEKFISACAECSKLVLLALK
jgi:hypothetical protein